MPQIVEITQQTVCEVMGTQLAYKSTVQALAVATRRMYELKF